MRSQKIARDAPQFDAIWVLTPEHTAAKLTSSLDLLAAGLSGMIEASSQVRQDSSNLWAPAASNPLVASVLASRARLSGNRWLFTILSLLVGAGLIVPILAQGFQGWKSGLGLVFVVMMMRESYKATIGAVELARGMQLLLFAASVVLFVVGFIVADAVIELGRLLFVPDLPADSGWFAFAFFVLIVLVFTAISTLWERFQPGSESTLQDLPAGFEKSALVAQRVAKKQRVKGIIGIDGCRVFRWPDGQRYEGAVKDGKPHGLGVFTWTNGTRHEGEWQKGHRHGYGVVVALDGSQTPGKWKDDQKTDEVVR